MAPAAAPSQSGQPAGGMPGMQGMQDMGGGMMGGMMDSMSAQMRMMDTVKAAQMKSMMPMHRQMVANILSQMTSEMRSMNMPASPEWTATVDSLRQDLIHMPEMGPQELKRFMPAHHARVMRLMDMHRSMMQGMKG